MEQLKRAKRRAEFVQFSSRKKSVAVGVVNPEQHFELFGVLGVTCDHRVRATARVRGTVRVQGRGRGRGRVRITIRVRVKIRVRVGIRSGFTEWFGCNL